MYDAIVVGARCAGSPTAMLLARKGYRVLLLDKSTFPSDIMSTHYIHPPGVERLRRWGLLDAVWASNCPRIAKTTLYFGEAPFTPPAPPGAPEACCPRRTVLDKILVDAAVAAGAELREGFSVKEIVADGNRIVGIRGTVKGGASVTEEARLVIGADGLHSTVARFVKPPEYNTKPTLSFGYYAYWSGVKERVGMVTARTSETFSLKWRHEEVQLGYEFMGRRAVPGAGRNDVFNPIDGYRSPPLPVTQGDHLEFVIRPTS